jgi:hypothetical protein
MVWLGVSKLDPIWSDSKWLENKWIGYGSSHLIVFFEVILWFNIN